MADVRVGIVSWNTGDLLDRCLAAVPAAVAGLDAEIVVVDNASGDDSAAIADRHAGVEVIRNETNEGYARGMNRALAGTDAPVLVALNPDTEPPPKSLAALVTSLRDRPRAALVVPRLCNEDGSLQPSVQRFPSLSLAVVSGFVPKRWQRGALGRRWWLEGAAPHDRTQPIDWAIGAVHVIRREALAGAKPYDERTFMYAEDLELCWRLHRDGWEVWLDAEVAVPHVGNASGAQAWGWRRAARYWAASYDFDAGARSAAHARAWAAVNLAASGAHYAVQSLAAITDGDHAAAHRYEAAVLRATLPVHARAIVRPAAPPG